MAQFEINDELLSQFKQALLSFDRLTTEQIIKEAIATSTNNQCIERLITPAMERIGSDWEKETVSMAQVYMSGRICEDLINTMLPSTKLVKQNQPKMAIAVIEDYHTLGKRILSTVLRASGFELLDYGHGIKAGNLADRVIEDKIDILLISALMLPAALKVKDVREKLNKLNHNVKIVVGGAPFRFDKKLWQEVGSDATGKDSSEAIKIITDLIEGGK
tara:strand:+ start:817 stop:1470 length:654 start_codon:yes stop_codon:yes gene_type:complete